MKPLKHFVLPEHTNTLYEKEAISSIALAKNIAKKINELVDAYNQLSVANLEKEQEQDGKIRKGVIFMKDNLLNSLHDLMSSLQADGYIDKRIQENMIELVNETQALTIRLNNLLGTVKAGTTTLDAEVIDGRVTYDNITHPSIGVAVREQVEELILHLVSIKKMINNVSNSNFIHINKIVQLTEQNNLNINFDRDNDTIILNGKTVGTVKVELNIDGSLIDDSKGTPYVMWNENIASEQAKTWGSRIFYNDGTISETIYSNVSHFRQVEPGKVIKKIEITFEGGFNFENRKLKFYGTYFANNTFLPYEKHYKLKNGFNNVLEKKKWASLGDSITANTGNDGVPWQKQVADFFNMEYTICGKGGSTTGGFAADDVYSKIPSDVDIITVMGGTNDHSQNLRLDVDGDEYYYNSGSYAGAIRSLIKKLQTDFPNAKIIFCNCLGVRLTETGVNQDLPYRNALQYSLVDYANKCIEVCQQMGIPCINLCGECGINTLNGATYLSDALHPNNLGYKKISDVYIQNFKRFIG